MSEQQFEFKLCSNGYNYLYKNNELYITEKGDYVLLEQKEDVVELLNELVEENKALKEQVGNDYNDGNLLTVRIADLSDENKELKSLLKECEHELTSNMGLSAFDKCASYIGYVEVFDTDIIDLDHSELLEKINKVDLE